MRLRLIVYKFIENWNILLLNIYTIVLKNISTIAEEVILAEERTTEAQRFHIIDARRRAATKMRKLKTLGRSHDKEDDTEEEPDESCKYFCL